MIGTLRNFAAFAKRGTRDSCRTCGIFTPLRPDGLKRRLAPPAPIAGQNVTFANGDVRVSLEDGCAMIELILTVCALSAPGQCQEQRLQFFRRGR